MNPLQLILLVDDSFDDNFVHRKLLESMEVAEEVVSCYDGREALDYLNSEGQYENAKPQLPQPDLLFLDLNMPRMNGWEFLLEYQKLPQERRTTKVIVMLTAHFEWVESNLLDKSMLNGHIEKPLTKDKVHQLLETFFPSHEEIE